MYGSSIQESINSLADVFILYVPTVSTDRSRYAYHSMAVGELSVLMTSNVLCPVLYPKSILFAGAVDVACERYYPMHAIHGSDGA